MIRFSIGADALILSVALLSAEFPGLRYLGDLLPLGSEWEPRASVHFGKATLVSTERDAVFEGRDDSGKKWRATLPMNSGIGYNAVWEADFDHNSRRDLLVAMWRPTSGRCIDEVTLSFLLFDHNGQPIPWISMTRGPGSTNRHPLPAIFADLNRNGKPELAVTDCVYSEPPGIGEDRSLVGVYEASDAMWSLSPPGGLGAYQALMRRNHPPMSKASKFLPPDPKSWTDEGNRLDPRAPRIQLAEILKASDDCQGVFHGVSVVHGRLQRDPGVDPCEETGHDRIRLADRTVCMGWPTVMIDTSEGREIVGEGAHPETLLQKLVDQQRPVIMAGQKDKTRCSPTIMWAPL